MECSDACPDICCEHACPWTKNPLPWNCPYNCDGHTDKEICDCSDCITHWNN